LDGNKPTVHEIVDTGIHEIAGKDRTAQRRYRYPDDVEYNMEEVSCTHALPPY
jgi:hypothetical protein